MSSENKQQPETSKETNENEDKELAELLDSALEDFGKDSTSKKEENDKTKTEAETSQGEAAKLPQEWSNDFIQQAAGQFEQDFASFMSKLDPNTEVTPELFNQKLKEMADAAQQVLANPSEITDSSVDFASTISQAIQGLNEGAEGLQTPFNEDALMKMLGGGQGQEADFLPFMQGMMQGLLSKEVLGPSLQDFVEKWPAFIEKNRTTLPKEDIERYENQKKLMEDVLEELNKEQPEDSADVKKERFTKVLAMMQKLQDYGQPPAELVGDVEAPFNFDPAGNPAMSMPNLDGGNNPECSVM